MHTWTRIRSPAEDLGVGAGFLGQSTAGLVVLLMATAEGVSVGSLNDTIIGVAGLEYLGKNVRLVQLVSNSPIMLDLYLAEVGMTKPKPRAIGCVCSDCGQVLRGRRNFMDHNKLHNTGPKACKYCSGGFMDKYYLNAHEVLCYHLCPFSVNQCSYKSRSKEAIRKHVGKFHRYDNLD